VKLLSWNIQHGGGTRVPRIVEEISAYDPDVVAVTEFCSMPGIAMRERGLAVHRIHGGTDIGSGVRRWFGHANVPRSASTA